MGARPSIGTWACDACGRTVPITSRHRVRVHARVRGGREECDRSGAELSLALVPLQGPVQVIEAPAPRSRPVLSGLVIRAPAPAGPWCGPRRWEDAGL